MATFQLPETVLLDCHPMTMGRLPQQAFALSLSNRMIEDMVKCVKNGQDIHLSTGDNPVSFPIMRLVETISIFLLVQVWDW